MELKEGQIADIRYTKTGTDEVTDRIVIPTVIPRNIKAIDVTGLNLAQRKEMQRANHEYRNYVKTAMATIYTFEDWMEHTGNKIDGVDTIKWRTFKPEQTEVL